MKTLQRSSVPYPSLFIGQLSENTCQASEESKSLPSSSLVRPPFIEYCHSGLLMRIYLSSSLDCRYWYCRSKRCDQGKGGDHVSQAKDEGEGSTEDGQNRYRLPEATRRLLQVPD